MKQTWKTYQLYGSIIIAVAALAYILSETIRAKNTGFEAKTLWDWMELLIIPLFLAGGAFFLNRSESAVDRRIADERAKLERKLATERQQDVALQAYLDGMAELLLKEKLLEAKNEKVLNVARVQTLTVMRGLNAARNGIVLRFLRDIGLAGNQASHLFAGANLEGVKLMRANLQGTLLISANLEHANLRRAVLLHANLQHARLEGANLEHAILTGAHLEDAMLTCARLKSAHLEGTHLERAVLRGARLESALLRDAKLDAAILMDAHLERAMLTGASLKGANLENANLEDANLRGANLENAYLKNANLRGAIVSNDQLARAQSLKGVTLPDGRKHE
jgi:uncharacterized protein YjbI with pentapeptide repeats